MSLDPADPGIVHIVQTGLAPGIDPRQNEGRDDFQKIAPVLLTRPFRQKTCPLLGDTRFSAGVLFAKHNIDTRDEPVRHIALGAIRHCKPEPASHATIDEKFIGPAQLDGRLRRHQCTDSFDNRNLEKRHDLHGPRTRHVWFKYQRQIDAVGIARPHQIGGPKRS